MSLLAKYKRSQHLISIFSSYLLENRHVECVEIMLRKLHCFPIKETVLYHFGVQTILCCVVRAYLVKPTTKMSPNIASLFSMMSLIII